MRFSAMSRNGGDVLVLPALSGQQHDAGSLLNSSLDAAPLGKNKQFVLRRGIQLDRLGNSHRSSLLGGWSMPREISSITSGAVH
jgi:hypothetical protein